MANSTWKILKESFAVENLRAHLKTTGPGVRLFLDLMMTIVLGVSLVFGYLGSTIVRYSQDVAYLQTKGTAATAKIEAQTFSRDHRGRTSLKVTYSFEARDGKRVTGRAERDRARDVFANATQLPILYDSQNPDRSNIVYALEHEWGEAMALLVLIVFLLPILLVIPIIYFRARMRLGRVA
jgi:hypothetical protein